MKPLDLDDSLKKAENELTSVDKSPFSNDGYEEFKTSIAGYIKGLLQQSIETARRQDVENVSAVHVKAASQYLTRFKKDKWKDFNNTLSGIFLGATFSNIFSYAFSDAKITIGGMIFTLVCGLVGAFMVGINLKNEM